MRLSLRPSSAVGPVLGSAWAWRTSPSCGAPRPARNARPARRERGCLASALQRRWTAQSAALHTEPAATTSGPGVWCWATRPPWHGTQAAAKAFRNPAREAAGMHPKCTPFWCPPIHERLPDTEGGSTTAQACFTKHQRLSAPQGRRDV